MFIAIVVDVAAVVAVTVTVPLLLVSLLLLHAILTILYEYRFVPHQSLVVPSYLLQIHNIYTTLCAIVATTESTCHTDHTIFHHSYCKYVPHIPPSFPSYLPHATMITLDLSRHLIMNLYWILLCITSMKIFHEPIYKV